MVEIYKELCVWATVQGPPVGSTEVLQMECGATWTEAVALQPQDARTSPVRLPSLSVVTYQTGSQR